MGLADLFCNIDLGAIDSVKRVESASQYRDAVINENENKCAEKNFTLIALYDLLIGARLIYVWVSYIKGGALARGRVTISSFATVAFVIGRSQVMKADGVLDGVFVCIF